MRSWRYLNIAGQLKKAWLVCAFAFTAVLTQTVAAQDEDGELIDQQPFDLITLTDKEGGESVKVAPLDFPGRVVPTDKKPTDKLEVVILRFPDRRYEVKWEAIKEIGIFEQRIYDEALQKMEEKDFIGAFQNLSYLIRNYPQMPRLEPLRQKFIYDSAKERYQAGDLTQTLSALETLKDTSPGYNPVQVERILSGVASKIIEAYQQTKDLASAKKLLARLKDKYGPTLGVVGEWNDRLEKLALDKKSEAVDLFREKKYLEARDAAMEMIGIYPDLPDGPELIKQINEVHPMVRVGVMQRSTQLDPASLTNWAARRSGKLAYTPLVGFLKTGSEGGKYGFALGQMRLSDDRQELILTIDPNVQQSLTGFGLTQQLLDRANPESETYDPSWAAILDEVEATSQTQVIVHLKRPNVLPHALMQWILPADADAVGSLPGEYLVSQQKDKLTTFKLRNSKTGGQPVEVVEIFYDDPKEAVNDLLRGDIDMLDQLYPADARRLRADTRLVVGSYALPTTHMLIPMSDDPYILKDKFRRALLYATNREGMLTGELLNSTNKSDGRLISGPFPIGDGQSDPLAYAYDPNIAPAPYNPQLAKLLVLISEKEITAVAKKKGEEPPKRKKLIVGCPDYEFARVAVQAMIQQWAIVGIEAEMSILPADKTFSKDNEFDLLYVTSTLWEPATDIERLLGGNGLAATDDPFIIHGLEKLRRARNWREVRNAMQDLHKLVSQHLPVLPLWQITDRFAVSKYVEGVGENPISLYQDIDAWRLNIDYLNSAAN